MVCCWAQGCNDTEGSLHGELCPSHPSLLRDMLHWCLLWIEEVSLSLGARHTAAVWLGEQHPIMNSRSCYLRLERGPFKFVVIGWLQMSMRSHQRFSRYGLSGCAAVIHSFVSSFRAWQRFYVNRKGFFLHHPRAIVDYLRHFNALRAIWPSQGDGAQLFSNMWMWQCGCTRLRISVIQFSSV